MAKLGHGYAVAGKSDDARTVLNQLHELSMRKYVSPHDLAMLHVGLEEIDNAFAWLLKALETTLPLAGLSHRRTSAGSVALPPAIPGFNSPYRSACLKMLTRLENGCGVFRTLAGGSASTLLE